jgi:hypothetical protein
MSSLNAERLRAMYNAVGFLVTLRMGRVLVYAPICRGLDVPQREVKVRRPKSLILILYLEYVPRSSGELRQGRDSHASSSALQDLINYKGFHWCRLIIG